MTRRTFLEAGAIAAGGFLLDRRSAWAQAPKGTPGATVDTTAGKVRGLLIDGKVHAFRGVPYGESTAGSRRFLPPLKVKPWTGVRDAFEIGRRSPQVESVLVHEWKTLSIGEP